MKALSSHKIAVTVAGSPSRLGGPTQNTCLQAASELQRHWNVIP